MFVYYISDSGKELLTDQSELTNLIHSKQITPWTQVYHTHKQVWQHAGQVYPSFFHNKELEGLPNNKTLLEEAKETPTLFLFSPIIAATILSFFLVTVTGKKDQKLQVSPSEKQPEEIEHTSLAASPPYSKGSTLELINSLESIPNLNSPTPILRKLQAILPPSKTINNTTKIAQRAYIVIPQAVKEYTSPDKLKAIRILAILSEKKHLSIFQAYSKRTEPIDIRALATITLHRHAPMEYSEELNSFCSDPAYTSTLIYELKNQFKIGILGEDYLAKLLHIPNSNLQLGICNILTEQGSTKCLADLETFYLSADSNKQPYLKSVATQTIKAIELRSKTL